MTQRTLTLRVQRFTRGQDDGPRLEEHTLSIGESATLIDALEQLRLEVDPGLSYRHSCHHGSCGTCGCRVDGVERLACLTRVSELEGETTTIEPLSGFALLGDLVVDATGLYQDLSAGWSLLREAEVLPREAARPTPAGLASRQRLEDCIECGLCVSACPVAGQGEPFLGPAALAALNRELDKTTDQGVAGELRGLAASPQRGQQLCQRAIDCSRRCPTGVAPARHIAALRKLLGEHVERGKGLNALDRGRQG